MRLVLEVAALMQSYRMSVASFHQVVNSCVMVIGCNPSCILGSNKCPCVKAVSHSNSGWIQASA